MIRVFIDRGGNFSKFIDWGSHRDASHRGTCTALARIAHYMDFKKPRSLMKSFEILQFNLCPLIWMFHSRALNNRINKLHEQALRLVLQNKNLSFNKLTKLGNAVTIHQRNLEVFVPVIFKVKITYHLK